MLKKSFDDGNEAEDLSLAIHNHGQGLPDRGRQCGVRWEAELVILNSHRLILLSHSHNIIPPALDSFNVN